MSFVPSEKIKYLWFMINLVTMTVRLKTEKKRKIFDLCQKILLKKYIFIRGSSYGGELARLGGLARLGEMIFIPLSYGIIYLSSIKKFVTSLEKDCLIE